MDPISNWLHCPIRQLCSSTRPAEPSDCKLVLSFRFFLLALIPSIRKISLELSFPLQDEAGLTTRVLSVAPVGAMLLIASTNGEQDQAGLISECNGPWITEAKEVDGGKESLDMKEGEAMA